MRSPAGLAALLALALAPHAAQAGKWKPPEATKVAAGLHDADQFGPQLRPDGQWLAYGVRDSAGKTEKLKWYARAVDGSSFNAIWPSNHPSFEGKEGIASFTDLVEFVWHPGGLTNAMVVRHKTKGDEVLLDYLKVRVGGPGSQRSPVFSPDGKTVVVVAQGDLGREIWLAPVQHEGKLEQLTFTVDTEAWMDWRPDGSEVLHEIINKKHGRSDLFSVDSKYYEQRVVLRLPDSDELRPSWTPDGQRIVFLSNKDDPSGRRYDLFSAGPDGQDVRPLLQGVRVSVTSRNYAWDPRGRFLIVARDDAKAGHPLVVLRPDGSAVQSLGLATTDNHDPMLVLLAPPEAPAAGQGAGASRQPAHDGAAESEPPREAPAEGQPAPPIAPQPTTARLVWTAPNSSAPEGRRYRVTWVADLDLAAIEALLGPWEPPEDPAPDGVDAGVEVPEHAAPATP